MRLRLVTRVATFGARFGVGAVALVLFAWPVTASASSSASYQIQEDFVGGTGGAYAASATYQSIDSSGAAAVGNGSSSTYKTQSGATTTNDPNLSFSIGSGSVSLGTLTTASTGTATATFSVLNYTSYGYIVQMLGSTPSYAGHNLTALSSGGSSTAGSEQFGINLVADTLPAALIGVSADPQQVPDSTYSNGTFGTGYGSANTYKYNSGDTIAQATQTSGQTNFTISYIANISATTPAGNYTGAETLICTGTY
ncbi:MAG TPA: hypothetical protein VLG11_05265 [Candidatus Saccharimonadales bacterium]|nr:hypothetical protein [Candidatus Saccharimonadales bacterium]